MFRSKLLGQRWLSLMPHPSSRHMMSWVLLLAACTGVCLAQQVTDATQDAKAKAGTELRSLLRASGWLQTEAQHIEVTGTLTRFMGTDSQDIPVHLWMSGPHNFREELSSGSTTNYVVIHAAGGRRKGPDGKVYRLTAQGAASLQRWTLPWAVLSEMMDRHEVESVGVENLDGQSSIVYRVVPRKNDATGARPAYDTSFKIHFASDGKSVRVNFLQPTDSNRLVTIPSTIIYEGLHLQAGVVIPTSEVLYRRGEKVSRLVFTQIDLNASADDSKFALETPDGEK